MITAKDWKKKGTTEILILPSGEGTDKETKVEVRKSKIKALLMANKLPHDLLSKVLKGKQDEMTEDEKGEMIKSSYKMFELIAQTVISPKIIIEGIPDEDNNEISILDIPDEDIEYLRNYIMGIKAAHDVEPFRTESAGNTA